MQDPGKVKSSSPSRKQKDIPCLLECLLVKCLSLAVSKESQASPAFLSFFHLVLSHQKLSSAHWILRHPGLPNPDLLHRVRMKHLLAGPEHPPPRLFRVGWRPHWDKSARLGLEPAVCSGQQGWGARYSWEAQPASSRLTDGSRNDLSHFRSLRVKNTCFWLWDGVLCSRLLGDRISIFCQEWGRRAGEEGWWEQ